MKTRILALLLALALLTACSPNTPTPPETPTSPEVPSEPALPVTPVFPAAPEEPEPPKYAVRYTTVYTDFPEMDTFSWDERQRLVTQFADDGEVIPLSLGYDGMLYATVPEEDKDRPIRFSIAEAAAFSDYDEFDWSFYPMTEAWLHDMLETDAEGKIRPQDYITRAEAFSAVLRLAGLEPGSDPEAAGRACGLIPAEIPALPSDSGISREEFMTLCGRALEMTGLARLEEADAAALAAKHAFMDAGDISPWARSSYLLPDIIHLQDYVYTGGVTPELVPEAVAYAYPQMLITRTQAAQVLNYTRSDYLVYPGKIALAYGFDKNMPVIDGSTSTYPFTTAIYHNLFSNGFHHPDLPKGHSKSHASYQRLIRGEVDAIIASVYPASDILQMAADAGVELELTPIAYDAMVFFTNKDNPVDGLTSQQIRDIYVSDAYDSWKQLGGPEVKLAPYCRNNDSGSHAQMERHFLGTDPIHPDIYVESSNSMSDILTDVISVPHEKPGSYGLGYSIYYYYHNMDMVYGTLHLLKLLAIDGVAPTDATIASGEYPLSNNTYLVVRKDAPADSSARRLAEFMLTETGQLCVVQAGFGPLDTNFKPYEHE